MKLHYINLNFAAIAFLLVGFLTEYWFKIPILLNITGLFYLLFVVPFTLLQLFRKDIFSPIERYFVCLTVFFFAYVPTFFFLNQWLGIKISFENILVANIGIFIFVLAIKKFNSSREITFDLNTLFNKRYRLLIVTLCIYALIHITNFHFYIFIPEWDGYADITKIAEGIDTGDTAQIYRGFFYTVSQILSSFSHIKPYALFTIVFIALQTSLVLVLFQLTKFYRIEKKSSEALIYLLALSVPVINMEIDMTRPQNVAILFFPIFIYFLFRFIVEKKLIYLLLTAMILGFGVNYHELFIFPALVYFSWFALTHLRRSFIRSVDIKDRTISKLIVFCSVLLFGLVISQNTSAQLVSGTLRSIVQQISRTSEWKLWFLNQYANDGETLQMGWSGLFGALKYYAYYISPAIFFILVILIAVIITNRRTMFRNPLLKIILPLLILLISFAEILPRLNFLYLPERFWIFIDILLIISLIPLLSSISFLKRRAIFLIFFLFCLIGLSGSFYIAMSKKSLTSPNEYRAALWIRENTPENAFFITQAANGIMVEFFAKRTTLPTDPSYFTSSDILERNPEAEIERLQSRLDELLSNTGTLVEQYTSNRIEFLEFADEIQKKKTEIKSARSDIEKWKKLVHQPRYIIYSFDKFDTIYREREWWRYTNAYGANIEKFNLAYPLVYQEGGIYIWKVR